MAVFGVPLVREDDALRAARAAVEANAALTRTIELARVKCSSAYGQRASALLNQTVAR